MSRKRSSLDDFGGDSDRRGARRYILGNHCIRTDVRVISNRDGTNDLGARANVHMTAEAGDTAASISDGDLLKEKAVGTDLGIGMNNDTVGMWNQQPAGNVAVERDVRAGDNRPEAMTDCCDPGSKSRTPAA